MNMAGTSQPDRFGCPHCLSVFRSGFARCPLDGSALQLLSGDPLLGSTLADRYVIEHLLGEGGMGRVYRARHTRMSRRFAIKVLFGELAADAKARARFSREAEASSRLTHPNVVSVVDFGESPEGLLYLVMEYLDGQELHGLILREGPFSSARTMNILRQLARGLGHAHERELVHRDFKAENVIVSRDAGEEIARIVDFGIAVVREVHDVDHRLTTEGMVLGTPAYMSPEQSTGEPMDHRADLFSLGVMLYEMLCGKLPFDGTPLAMAKANLAMRVPRIAERVAGLAVDERLEAVAMRLMAKDPADRFQSAADLLAHLDVLYGRPADTDVTALFGAGESEAAGAAASAPAATGPDTVVDAPRAGESRDGAATADPWPRQDSEPLQIDGLESRRWFLAGAAVVVTVVVAGGALWLHQRGQRLERRAGGAAAAPAAGAPVGAAEPTGPTDVPAAAPDPALVADAGAPASGAAQPALAETEADAGPATASEAPATPRRRGRRKPAAAERVRQPAAAAEEVSPEEFVRRYRRVGALVDRLTREKGEDQVADLRDRYFRIPYTDALRNPSVRRDAEEALRRLSGRIERELRGSP